MAGPWRRHPSEAEWADYLDERPGGLDEPTRAALRAHLRGCARCQGTLERVDAVRRLLHAPMSEPDELSWRRMEARIEAARLSPGGETGYFSVDLPDGGPPFVPDGGPPFASPTPDPRTVDIVRGRRWLLAGLAATVVVAFFVALAPRGSEPPPVRAPRIASKRSAVIESGAAPLEVELGSGERLGLSSFTELVLPAPDRAPPRIELTHGRFDLWSPRPLPESPAARPPVLVRTPDVDVWARSRDFSVGYQAGRHYVEVREGVAEVEGPEISHRIQEGETRSFRVSYPGPAEPALAILDRLREAPAGASAPPRAKNPERARPPSRRALAPPPRAKSSAEEVAAAGEPLTFGPPGSRPGGPRATLSSPETDAPGEPETIVERLEPALEGPERTLAEARRAWFEAGDAQQASDLALRALESARDPGLVRAALELRCDAQVRLRTGRAAAAACSELLDHENDPARRRRIHYTLGVIHRDHLGDCGEAVRHFDQAVVFGRHTRFDNVVRLRRAECALDMGDLGQARADLDALRGQTVEADRLRRAVESLANLEKEAGDITNDAE